jgi:hypothetical protein
LGAPNNAKQRHRPAGVQEDDVFILLEVTLAHQVNQPCQALARVNRVEQQTFGWGQQRDGLDPAGPRNAATASRKAAVRDRTAAE